MASILEEQQRRWGRQRPLFERFQDWMARQKLGGGGAHLFRAGLFGFLALNVILFYTGTQFYGLRDARAMDLGQLAQNLRSGNGYVTRNLRPVDLYHLGELGRPTLQGQLTMIPELWTPPVYPWVLSLALRAVGGAPSAEVAGRFLSGDRVLMMVGWLFFAAGLWLMYLVGNLLFDRRVAVLAAFLYLFCDPLLDSAIAGVPAGFYSVLLLLVIYGLLKAEQWQGAGVGAWRISLALAGSALALGIGILTDYLFAALVVPFLLAVRLGFGQYWRRLGLVAVVLAVVVAPWVVRNYRVSRTFFGLARYSLIEGVGRGTPNEIPEGQVQRTFGPAPKLGWRSIVREALMNGRQLYQVTFKETGASYLMVFFLVSLLHRFRRDEVVRMRRFLFWALLGAALWVMVVGVPTRNPLTFFLPAVMLYAAAFFYVLFERLRFRTRLRRTGMVMLFAVVNCIPFGLAILPPRDTHPYPPYVPEVVGKLGRVFGPTEVLSSDMPWAVAWYAQRSAVWLPLSETAYMQLHDGLRNIAGIYLTQLTFGTRFQEWAQGRERFWINFFMAPPPGDFPLKESRPLTPDNAQFLVTNRPL